MARPSICLTCTPVNTMISFPGPTATSEGSFSSIQGSSRTRPANRRVQGPPAHVRAWERDHLGQVGPLVRAALGHARQATRMVVDGDNALPYALFARNLRKCARGKVTGSSIARLAFPGEQLPWTPR